MRHEDMSAFLKSNTFAKIIAALGVLIILLFVFEAGVIVGFHRAEFADHWQEHYNQNFGPSGMYGMPGPGVPIPHGASGKIVSVSLPTFVIAGPDEVEKIVRIGSSTLIRDGASTVGADDLTAGDYATVIGSPNNAGEIDAALIRVLPSPEAGTSTEGMGSMMFFFQSSR